MKNNILKAVNQTFSMKQVFLLLLIATTSLVSFSQSISLDVLMGEKHIGEITVEKKVRGKIVNATLSSKVSVSMIIKVNVNQTIVSEYNDGKLMKTNVVRVSNISSENKTSAITWNGNEYIIKKDTVITTLKEPVTYCVLDLYFTEPVAITKVFGETGGTFMPMKSLGDHRYELQVNDSKKDLFTYGSTGKLMQIETIIAMKKVTFKVK